ncbi:chaperone for protein-folding within the ER, fungal-domain-containing protein [Mycena galericulata]|nr:chaperone for protein-folding within the ER, fungal-domain-containing protein [Mycena galericulata]
MLNLLALFLAGITVFAQDTYNTSSIVGTWSSGSQQVVPGAGFANPSQETFNYPKAAGVGYSFSDDGWYEIARFRYVANASNPDCIVSTVIWAHGTYDLLVNGSIILTPLGDGYQQVQSACGDDSNFMQNYNVTEFYVSWEIFIDVTYGPKLHLFQFDGSPVAPLFQLSPEPNMLPKQKLRNMAVQVVTTTSDGLISTETIVSRKAKRHAPEMRRGWSSFWAW